MLGHRHDLHDPYRLTDHYFMDQVRHPVTSNSDAKRVKLNCLAIYLFTLASSCKYEFLQPAVFNIHSVFLLSRCLGFPVMSPSRKTRKSSASTLGSGAGNEPPSATMDARRTAPLSRATRTTDTPPCGTSSSKWKTLSRTSTLPRQSRRSTTTPTLWPPPCRPQTLTPLSDPWSIRARAARTARASPRWSPSSLDPSSRAPHRPQMAGRGEKRTGWSALSVSIAARLFTSPTTGEVGATMRRTLCRGASGGSAACGWQTLCSTTACQTQRGTTRTPAPVTGARAEVEADLALAG